MASRQFGAKPLLEPVVASCKNESIKEQLQEILKLDMSNEHFLLRKLI